MKKIKEDDFGLLEWVDTGQGSGFWSRLEDPEITKLRVPERCPACGQGIDNWSIEKSYHRNGVCMDCSIIYLDNRTFPEGFFKDRDAKVEYCKQKIAEKLKK